MQCLSFVKQSVYSPYCVFVCFRGRAQVCGENGWVWCTVTRSSTCLDTPSTCLYSTTLERETSVCGSCKPTPGLRLPGEFTVEHVYSEHHWLYKFHNILSPLCSSKWHLFKSCSVCLTPRHLHWWHRNVFTSFLQTFCLRTLNRIVSKFFKSLI